MRLRWWLIGYVILVALVIAGMIRARHYALSQLSTPESLAQWREWREDVRQEQSAPHAVERRVPTSDEPPALILMRDYFAVSLTGAVLFTTVLYWIIAWFVTGMLR